ncbi:PH domain-containing protein [Jeotgalicoccus sp. WY2]|uniref:PH domain-containing protein n=1 Tax=Jeotgalicoccus sp. WY2 TaxID=2708346 RepID=UPI002020D03C|nr:PH domain-containing protein [Jeotgalicoccus sp. WY2]
MYNPQKLHPVAYAGSVVKGIKTTFFPAIIIFFNMREELFSGSINPWMLFGGIGILALIFIVFTGFDMLNIYRTRFWLENNKFVFKNGIFTRNEKELDIKRIQSIDFNQPFFHRIFGAVQLDILTPGDGIKIDTIKKSQGEDIQKVIYETQQDIESEETAVNIGDASVWPKEQNTEITPKTAAREFATLKKMNFKELILMAMTSGGLGVFAAIFFGVLNVVGGEILIENYFEYVSGIVRSLIFSIVIASMVFVIIGYVIGTVIIMVRNYDYTLKKAVRI